MKCVHRRLEHLGGGTCLVGNSSYPSDDDFECRDCGSVIYVKSTVNAHFDMPDYLSLIQLRKKKGVRVKKILKPEEYFSPEEFAKDFLIDQEKTIKKLLKQHLRDLESVKKLKGKRQKDYLANTFDCLKGYSFK